MYYIVLKRKVIVGIHTGVGLIREKKVRLDEVQLLG